MNEMLGRAFAMAGAVTMSACAGTLTHSAADASRTAEPPCVHFEEQLAELVSAHGKPALVLEGAFQQNACSGQAYWSVGQSRIAATKSHVVIFGPEDDRADFLDLSRHNAAIIESSLPPEVLNKTMSVEADIGGLPLGSLDNTLEECLLPITYPSSAPGLLWAVKHRIKLVPFCIGAADYFAVYGLALEKSGKAIVANHRAEQ